MKRIIILAVIAAPAIFLITQIWPMSATTRFNITVTLSSNSTEYTATNVWQLSSDRHYGSQNSGQSTYNKFRGEALVFETIDNNKILVLRRQSLGISSENLSRILYTCMPPSRSVAEYLQNINNARIDCHPDPKLLQIVTFSGTPTPENLVEISPADDNIYIKDIHLLSIDKPISIGIRSIFPWLKDSNPDSDINNTTPPVNIESPFNIKLTITAPGKYYVRDFTTEIY